MGGWTVKELTIDAHPMGVPGVWRIRYGRKVVATLVQPNVSVEMHILPTAQEVRDAVRDVSPDCGITDETPVRWAGGELNKWSGR